MEDLEMLVREYGLTSEKIIAVLELQEWHLENGLQNFQFNSPMANFLRGEMEAKGIVRKNQKSGDWDDHHLSNN